MLITTSNHPSPQQIAEAQALAARVGGEYLRRQRPMGEIPPQGILVIEKSRWVVQTPQETFFYHPGMAIPRIKRISQGEPDPMLTAMDLRPGDSVLDCTLGLASDALVASYWVGAAGEVVGLESSEVIALLTQEGLQRYPFTRNELTQAASRIQVRAQSYQDVLPTLLDGSFDCVYFDPMFNHPVQESTGIGPLRRFADATPLHARWVEEATRVARRRVVVKERIGSPLFEALGLIPVKEKSRIVYGVLEVDP